MNDRRLEFILNDARRCRNLLDHDHVYNFYKKRIVGLRLQTAEHSEAIKKLCEILENK